MKNYKILGVSKGTSKAGKPYTRVSIADESNEKWEGVHAFEAFLRGDSDKIKPGVTVPGIVSYNDGLCSLNV